MLVTKVSYEPDELGLEADHRRMGRRVSAGGEVLHGTENIFTGLANSMHLLQELCVKNRLEIHFMLRNNPTQLFHQGRNLE